MSVEPKIYTYVSVCFPVDHICTCITYLCKYIECAYLPAVHMVEEAQTQVVKTLIERRVHHGLLIVTPAGSLHVQEVTCQNMQCNMSVYIQDVTCQNSAFMSVSTYKKWPVKIVQYVSLNVQEGTCQNSEICQSPSTGSDLSNQWKTSVFTNRKWLVKTVQYVSLHIQEVTRHFSAICQSPHWGSDLSKQCNMSVSTYRNWPVISVQYVSLNVQERTCQNSAICQVVLLNAHCMQIDWLIDWLIDFV